MPKGVFKRKARSNKKEQILLAARKMYHQDGLVNTTIEQIADEAGVSRSLISAHFGGKVELIKAMLRPRVADERLWALLTHIIDSGADAEGKGVPLGNQTSQWFSLFYLDPLDRLVKERLRIRWYGRYMDDFICIHHDKAYLQECLRQITALAEELGLTLNPKTQIFPVKNGVDYLGFHIYLTDTGKVIRKLRRSSKTGMKRRLRLFQQKYANREMEWEDIRQHMASWRGHAAHGHTWQLREKISNEAVFVRSNPTN